MSEAVLIAIITAGCALLGTYLTVRSGNQRILAEMEKHEAVQDERIKQLTDEVRKHNDFAQRVPVLEEKVHQLEISK